MSNIANSNFNPDVLNCIANLSNDEVFTSPKIANQMLDLLPEDIWKDRNAKFLDPFAKSGVFLREITKRLLNAQMPNYEEMVKSIEEKEDNDIPLDDNDTLFKEELQKTIDHILHNQVYGIAITELTSLLARRSVYCSKYPNCKYSISEFDTADGNIRFKKVKHTFKDGKCVYCGASQEGYDRDESLETYAYEFIHVNDPKEIYKDMKFDVIIGNPPYQLSFGIEGANSSNAQSIYNKFIEKAIKLNPKHLTMIVPSRWMTKTAQGIPESWVDNMLSSNKFKIIHDFEDAKNCFAGISLTGGVNYFLWERDYQGKCDYYYHTPEGNVILRKDFLDSKKAGIVIRDPKSYSIINKIVAKIGDYFLTEDSNFSGLVSPKHYFDDSKYLTSNWKDYKDNCSNEYCIKYYVNVDRNRTFKWISEKQLPKNKQTKDLHKVYIPAANGSMDNVLGKPFYGEPNSVCSQTYLVIGYKKEHSLSKEQCLNIIDYISTKFFRYLVLIKKKTQNGPRGVYQFVPLIDFNQKWDDKKLFNYFNLSEEEISIIESTVKPMNLSSGGDANE